MHFELFWIPGRSVGLLSDLFIIFELTMVVVRERKALYIWNLLQAISKSGLDHFEISSQSNTSTLIEVMKTIYSPNPILILSPDVEIIIDVPETKEVTFTLVTSKKSKKKGQSVFFPSY